MNELLEKVTENKIAFGNKVEEISKQLSIPSSWLLFVMWFESKLNSRAVNANTNATGLIQFMPATAKSLGTSVAALKAMSNVEQLDYVYKYLKPMRAKFKSFVDVYLSVFFPLAVGKPDSYVLRTDTLSPATIAKANKIFDLDEDKQVTVGEIKERLLNTMPEPIRKIIDVIKKNPAKGVVGVLTISILLYLYFQK